MTIELGIGVSSQADVTAAGRQAAEQVMTHLGGRTPSLTLVFSSIRFADPRLLRAIRAVTSNAPLIGCTDAGGITTAGTRRRSVTVIGLLAPAGAFVTGVEHHLSKNPRHAGEALATDLLRQSSASAPRAMVVFPDGLTANGSDLLRGLQRKLGESLPIVGGSAADDFFFERTFQYFNDEVLTDSLPGALFCGEVVVGIGVRHGWIPLGRSRRVTRASGHVIHELDRKPAISIYEDYLGFKRADLTAEPLANLAITYPLGTAQDGQPEYLLRDAIRVGRAGSLICTGNVRQGSTVRLMIGGHESALEAAQQAAGSAVEQVGRGRLKGALVFCSVGRQKMLGTEFQGEIDVIRDALGGAGVRLGGFYGYGELAPASAARKGKIHNTFHNESVVVMALG